MEAIHILLRKYKPIKKELQDNVTYLQKEFWKQIWNYE